MSKVRKVLGALALAAVAAMFGIGAIALAQPAEAGASTLTDVRGGRGFCSQAGLAAAAQALGLTTAELQTQFRGGESLADVAEAEGVELQAVLDAVDAACSQATKDAIAQAVTDGTLTQAHADWLIEGLDAGYWGGTNGGIGFGGGHRGGFGGFMDGRGPGPFNAAPRATPAIDS